MLNLQRLAQFGKNSSGNIAVLFGLLLIPTIGAVGASLDYSHAANVRSRLSNALDAAVIRVAEQSANLNDDQVFESIDSEVRNRMARPDLQDLDVRARRDLSSSTISATAKGSVPTTVARVLGFTSMPIAATSVSAFNSQNLEIVLVLDNTGSMGNAIVSSKGGPSVPKIQSLTSAARAFVKFMKNLAGADQNKIKIAVVPFDTGVRFDSRLSRSYWVQSGQSMPESWSGCIYDRDPPNDVLDTQPSMAVSSTLFPPDPSRLENKDCRLAPIEPLTSNFGQLEGALQKMQAAGNTNLTVGLAWGFHALTTQEPLTQGSSSGNGIQKYIVLMTDGQNTANRWGRDVKSIDSKTSQICKNIKNDGIKIYSIATSDANTNLLKSCASSSEMYYQLSDASDFGAVFQDIASKITHIRLAK